MAPAEQEAADFLGWILSGVVTIIATLAGLVAKFYQTQISDYKSNTQAMQTKIGELETRADECESDRTTLTVRCAVLEERISSVEKKVRGE